MSTARPQARPRHRRQRRHRPGDRRAAGARRRPRHRACQRPARRGARRSPRESSPRAAAPSGRLRRHRSRRARKPPASGCSPAARSRSSSTTPASTTTPSSRHARRAVAARHRRLAQRLLQRHPAARDADDAHALGPDRQLSSVAALTGNRGQVNYAAAKGALNSATKALALELASRGITVNAVAPGHHRRRHGRGARSTAAMIEKMVPMKRAGTRRAKSRRWWPSSPRTRPPTSAARSSRSTAR